MPVVFLFYKIQLACFLTKMPYIEPCYVMSYIQLSNILKVIANPSRLEILDLLSCGELCACDLLYTF